MPECHDPSDVRTIYQARRRAKLLTARGSHSAALPYWERALELTSRLFGPEHKTMIFCLQGTAKCLTSLSRHQEALPYWVRVVELTYRLFGPDHQTTRVPFGEP